MDPNPRKSADSQFASVPDEPEVIALTRASALLLLLKIKSCPISARAGRLPTAPAVIIVACCYWPDGLVCVSRLHGMVYHKAIDALLLSELAAPSLQRTPIFAERRANTCVSRPQQIR
jgi:hypothetical protein